MSTHAFTDDQQELLVQIVEYELELALDDENDGRAQVLRAILAELEQ